MKTIPFSLILFLLAATNCLAQLPTCPGPFVPFVGSTKLDGLLLPLPPGLPEAPPPGDSDKRGIYWVHGLGGGQDSWAKASHATDFGHIPAGFPARKSNGVTMAEYVQEDLPTSGDDLIDDMQTYDHSMTNAGVSDFTRNYIIAHSQGGLVSRTADKLIVQNSLEAERRFYGLVTFGTPHAGAKILNSRDDGKLQSFVQDACETVLTTEAKEFLYSKPLIDFFVSNTAIESGVSALCAIGGNVLPTIMSDLYKGATLDYKVGAANLNQLNSFSSNLHKAEFAGIEYGETETNTANPKQLFWRTMGSFKTTGPADYFKADIDNSLVDWATTLRAEYQAKYDYHNHLVFLAQLYSPAPCSAIDWILHFNQCTEWDNVFWKNIEKRDVYGHALQWIDGVDDQWKIIIGALEYQEDEGEEHCVCLLSPPNELSVVVEEVASPQACLHYASTHQGIESCNWIPGMEIGQWVYKESDGVVTRESAESFPGAVFTNQYRMEHTNHFQMRNSSETKKSLLFLYNAGGPDLWFTTPQQ